MIGRFSFYRHRRGWFVECRWFFARIYPPTMPRISLWRKR